MDTRHIRTNRNRVWNWIGLPASFVQKSSLFSFGLLAWGTFFGQGAWAQLTPLSPSVDQVRAILIQVSDTPDEREIRLKKAIQSLQTNRERREAFLLHDWRDTYEELPVSVTDRKVRLELSQVLIRDYKAILQSREKEKINLLLDKLPEFARQGDESPAVAALLKELAIEISFLAKQAPVETRRMALITLAKIHADQALVIPLFSQLIRDNQAEVRHAAAEGVDTLIKLQLPGNYAKGNTQPLHLRREAIASVTAKLIPIAMQGLRDPQSKTRILSSETLLTSTVLFSSLIGDPNQTLAGLDPAEIRRMMQVEWEELDPMHQTWAKSLPGLGAGLVDRNPQVRLNCQKTLDELAGIRAKRQKQGDALGINLPDLLSNPIRGAIPTLVEALRDPDIRVRRAAIDVLEGLGPIAIGAAQTLQSSLDDPDPFVRWASLRALTAMGPDILRQSKGKILTMTQDPDPDVRKAVETSVRKMGN